MDFFFLGAPVHLRIFFALLLAMATAMPRNMEGLLAQHNMLRCMHDASPLVWDDSLANDAQAYAQSFVETSDPKQSNVEEGENLLMGDVVSGVRATQEWYDEVKSTVFGEVTSYSPETGHYTQLVWNSTTKLGCGEATLNNGQILWVCRYSPAGNRDGEFSQQVGRRVKTAVDCGTSISPVEMPKKITWAFGNDPATCAEVGFISIMRCSDSEANARGSGVEEYDIVGFGVRQSAAGLPLGSTETGAYELPPNVGDGGMILQASVVTGDVWFRGTGPHPGQLHVGDFVLGDGLGQVDGGSCTANLFFVTDLDMTSSRKFELASQSLSPQTSSSSWAWVLVATGVASCALLSVAASMVHRNVASVMSARQSEAEPLAVEGDT